MPVATNIRVLIPRTRRKIEGAGAPPTFTDDVIRDIVADAIAGMILYTGSFFGKTLDVAGVDPVTGAPSEYTTSDPLSWAEQTVMVDQAALDFFFFAFLDKKTSETIKDEAQEWTYQISANLLGQQLKQLADERDKALEALAESSTQLDGYVSFLITRDRHTATLVEPWTRFVGGDVGEFDLGGFGMRGC